MRSILCRYSGSSFPFLSGCCLFLNKSVMVHILTILLVPSTPVPGESSLRAVIGFGWFCSCDVTVCSKGMVQSWWGTWILGVSCLHPLLLMGWPPGRSGQNRPALGPCSSLFSVPLPTPLLQYSTAASRPTDGASDKRILRESDGTDPSVESQVLSVLWHPAPADVANKRP